MKRIFLTIPLLLLTACSHVGNTKSAQEKVATARQNVDLADKAKWMRVADYNREVRVVVDMPWDAATQKAAQAILDLQYNITGQGKMTDKDRRKFVEMLIKDDLRSHRLLYQANKNDAELNVKYSEAVQKADVLQAKYDALAVKDATLADKYEKLWNMFYILIGLVFAALVLRVLYALGMLGAKAAI